MSGERLACRFTASWTEGVVAFGSSPAAHRGEAGTPPVVSAALARHAAESTPPDPRTQAAIDEARARGLPSRFDPDGLSFGAFTPIYVQHGHGDTRLEIGMAQIVDRQGDTFDASGWVHPDHLEAAAGRRECSPLLGIDQASIVDDVLVVSRSELVELSLVLVGAKPGTSATVGPPREVPADQWAVLERTSAAFSDHPESFRADPSADRMSIAGLPATAGAF